MHEADILVLPFKPQLPGEASLTLQIPRSYPSGRNGPTSLHQSRWRLVGPGRWTLPQAQAGAKAWRRDRAGATRRARPFHGFRRRRAVPARARGSGARQGTIGVYIGPSGRGCGHHAADREGAPGPGVQPTGKVTLQAATLTHSCRWGQWRAGEARRANLRRGH